MSCKLTYGIIWAEDDAGGIGKCGRIPWRDTLAGKSDMRRFRNLTLDCTLICGRITAEEFGWKLPRRQVIVVSSHDLPELADSTTRRAGSLSEALKMAHTTPTSAVWVIGGARLYEEAISRGDWDRLSVTRIPGDYGCDCFAPDLPADYSHICISPP
jgi:dihydrofolate reductase